MKQTIVLVLLFLCSMPPSALEAGYTGSNFTLQGSDGQTYSLSDFRGRQSVVLAWLKRIIPEATQLSVSRYLRMATY